MCIGSKIKVAFAHKRILLMLLEKIFSIAWEKSIGIKKERKSERKDVKGKKWFSQLPVIRIRDFHQNRSMECA